jgi:hypothetical protein
MGQSGMPVRNNSLDAINGSAALTFVGATVAGWTIQEWAAAAALVYSLILIADKFGIWAPIRGAMIWPFRWAWSKVHRNGRR